MDFQTFHKYNRLVRRGVAKPLACQHCDTELTLMMGEDDKPALRCFGCGVIVYPGLNMYRDVRAVVKEHFA